jgi:hypothetical protein
VSPTSLRCDGLATTAPGSYLFDSTRVIVLTTLIGPGLSTRTHGINRAVLLAVLPRRSVKQPALNLEGLDTRRPEVAS